MKKHVKWNLYVSKDKYDKHFKNFTKYIYLSWIHIINCGTWFYFNLSLYVAQPFTNGTFEITRASKMVPTPLGSKSSVDGPIHFKFPIAPIVGEGGGGKGFSSVLSTVKGSVDPKYLRTTRTKICYLGENKWAREREEIETLKER